MPRTRYTFSATLTDWSAGAAALRRLERQVKTGDGLGPGLSVPDHAALGRSTANYRLGASRCPAINGFIVETVHSYPNEGRHRADPRRHLPRSSRREPMRSMDQDYDYYGDYDDRQDQSGGPWGLPLGGLDGRRRRALAVRPADRLPRYGESHRRHRRPECSGCPARPSSRCALAGAAVLIAGNRIECGTPRGQLRWPRLTLTGTYRFADVPTGSYGLLFVYEDPTFAQGKPAR